jgi:hypothetical protein
MYEVTKDIVTVEWLSLAAVIKRLSHPLERLFLVCAASAQKGARRKRLSPRPD